MPTKSSTVLTTRALRGIGIIAILGLGISLFNRFDDTLTPREHNVADTEQTNAEIWTTDDSPSQTEETLATLQSELETIKNDTSLEQEVRSLHDQLTDLQQTLLTLQSGQTSLESWFSTLFPLGTLIATNGTVNKEQMNALGRALSDGSAIASQVRDAKLEGNTLNLAGRTLVGEGTYAKDETVMFQLGHVDEYMKNNLAQSGEVQHQLTFAEMPYHTHGMSMKLAQGGTAESINIVNEKYSTLSAMGVNTQPAGGDQPHNNMPPFHVVQWYLKVK